MSRVDARAVALARSALGCAAIAACGGSSADPAAVGAVGEASAEGAWFREVAAERGVDFVHVPFHERRHWVPEISSGAVALFDADGDGDLDLYCVQSGTLDPPGGGTERNRFFRNEGGGRFVDATEGSGLGDPGYGHGVATGDYDGDGDLDVFVSNLGPNKLFRNEGDGTFTDVTAEAGVAGSESGWSAGATFADYDLDGDYDLFVVDNLSWSPSIERTCRTSRGELDYCAPTNYNAPSTDALYRNEGDGTFTDVSAEAGLGATSGAGWGVVAADVDGNGFPDFYVTNDGMSNALWLNDGEGRFVDDARLAGCAVNGNGKPEAGMGVQVIDVENDGHWDLFMTHVRNESNTFYSGRGGGFADRTAVTGLGNTSMKYTGFGMGFHDFDHDGWLDLFIANGRVTLFRPVMREDRPYAEPNQLYRGLGRAKFEELPRPTAEERIAVSRAVAFGDFDDDGDVDLVYVDNHEPLKLLENVAPRRGGWVGFRLLDPRGADALGAVLRLELAGECAVPVQNEVLQTGYSYCAANDPRVHFGVGAATGVERLSVTWPDGERTTHGPFELGRYHTLRQSSE